MLRLGLANRRRYTTRSMLTSVLPLREIKTKIYVAYLLPIVIYVRETRKTTKSDKLKLLTFVRKILKTIINRPSLNSDSESYERKKIKKTKTFLIR